MGLFTHSRLPDWTARWSEFIRDCLQLEQDLKLDWGTINCTQFMGDGIEVLTGHNPYDEFRGKFGNAIGACRVIKESGFNTLDELVAAYFDEVPVGMAWAGDVVLVKALPWAGDEEVSALMPHGVVLADPPVYYSVNEGGLAKGDLYTDGVRAFAIGREV